MNIGLVGVDTAMQAEFEHATVWDSFMEPEETQDLLVIGDGVDDPLQTTRQWLKATAARVVLIVSEEADKWAGLALITPGLSRDVFVTASLDDRIAKHAFMRAVQTSKKPEKETSGDGWLRRLLRGRIQS